MVYLVNLSKAHFIVGKNKHLGKVKAWVEAHGGGLVIPLSIEFEEELSAFEKSGDTAAAAAMLAQVEGEGRQKSVLPRVVKCGFKQLNLIYYFTAGEKEVRCWTIMQGATAPQAAGVIHGDFERGFIKVRIYLTSHFQTQLTSHVSWAGGVLCI